MVFGWGKKKLEQSEVDVVPEEKQISLTEISDIIKDIRSIRTRTIIAEVKAFRNKINSDRKTILEIANQLERDTLNVDEMDVHLMRLVKRGKNEIISVIKRECKVTFPEINSFENVQTFDRLASRMLKKIGDALGRHSQVIHIFAKKYAKKLKSDLKIMTDGNSHVIELIENYNELEDKIKQLFENIGKHDQAQKSIITLEQYKDDTAKTLHDLNEAIKHDAEDIKNIKDSNEYAEFLKTKEKKLVKEQEIPSGHKPKDYIVERLACKSNDGRLVPITITRHKKTKIDGSANLLLYGYGSYGSSMSPSFSSTRLSLIDRNIMYAKIFLKPARAIEFIAIDFVIMSTGASFDD